MSRISILTASLLTASTLFAAKPPLRGVVEGYYGRPWGTEGRLSLIEFMGENDLNCFIYGPKDDPYHHAKWREPYPAAELADFKKLLAAAKKNRVNFYWAIHLGGGFKKGSAEDYVALFRKLGWMYDAGFRSFAIFFDDFGGADAKFHAEICNRVQKEFIETKKDCSRLVMCPNVYWGSGYPYQKTLGAELDKAVDVMWTGRTICHDINRADVAKISADLQRPPFIWWNWPVNDYCRKKLLLGRTYGLDDCDYAGFVANPMENCEANKIALKGVADWCREPSKFDSVKSWNDSFAKIYSDPVVAAAMRVFAEHNSDQGENFHGYHREESVSAAPLCSRAREEVKGSGRLKPETAKELEKLFRQVAEASRTLIEKLPSDKGLGWELEGWLKVEIEQMRQGVAAIHLMQAKRKDERAKWLGRIRESRKADAEAAAAHIAKFQAATFANDRKNVKRPDCSTRELRPTVELLLATELKRLYKEKTGEDYDLSGGFKAFSAATDLKNLVVSRDGKYAGIVKVMEQKTIKPGESFGIAVPSDWTPDYFHARLSPEAVHSGVIEVSKDGLQWEKLATQNKGANMETPLKTDAGWRQARYRNVGEKPVTTKIDLFKFDVRGESSPVDALLERLAE